MGFLESSFKLFPADLDTNLLWVQGSTFFPLHHPPTTGVGLQLRAAEPLTGTEDKALCSITDSLLQPAQPMQLGFHTGSSHLPLIKSLAVTHSSWEC